MWWRRAYPAGYYVLVRRLSPVWGAAFALLDHRLAYALVQPFRRAWNVLVARRFIRALRADPPDLVIASHFFPADVVSACKRAGWLRAPLIVIVTDLHPHRFWLSREADAYVVATGQGARTAERRGIPRERLRVIGIPVSREFHTAFDRRRLEALWQLEPGRRTVLVTSGATTVGPFEAVVEAVMKLERIMPGRIQMLVVCGQDAAAARRLQERARRARMPVQVFGFVHAMPKLMAASDLVVAKAGGLTVTEALARGVPVLLYHIIPGQESLNARYVVEHGAGLIVRHPDHVAAAVRRCFEDPAYLSAMQRAAKALGRPDAAEEIVSQVVAPLLAKGTGSHGA